MIGVFRVDVRAGGIIQCSSGTEVEVVRISASCNGILHDILQEGVVYLEHSHHIKLCRVELEIQFLVGTGVSEGVGNDVPLVFRTVLIII